MAGYVASTLRLNALIGLLGLELIPAVAATERRKSMRRLTTTAEDELVFPEARLEELHRDMAEYRSDEDPDFNSGVSSGSSSETDGRKTSSSISSSSSSEESEDETVETVEVAEELKEA